MRTMRHYCYRCHCCSKLVASLELDRSHLCQMQKRRTRSGLAHIACQGHAHTCEYTARNRLITRMCVCVCTRMVTLARYKPHDDAAL